MTPAPTKRELPEGWRWVRLAEVIREAQGGFASGERDPKGVVQLRMNNVTNRGGFDWGSVVRVPADRETIETYRLLEEDVVFNNTNSTELVGKTALFEGYCEPVLFSNHFTRLRTIPELLTPPFLAFWLQERWQRRVFADICNRWIGQSAVQRDKLLALDMPLPPLAEQKRIAGVLSEQVGAVERARAAAEAQLEAAKALPAAYLRAVFSSPEAQRWPKRRLRDLSFDATAFADGPFGSNLKTEHYTPGGARVVRLQNVGRGEFLGDDRAYISMEHFLGLQRYHVRPGDVIVASLGDGARPAGRACVIPEDFGPGLVKADCFRVRLPSEVVHAPYLLAFLNSPQSLSAMAEKMRGATRPRLTLGILRDITIGLPSISEQQRMASTAWSQIAAAGQAHKALEQQLAAINALPTVLLRRAFSGEL